MGMLANSLARIPAPNARGFLGFLRLLSLKTAIDNAQRSLLDVPKGMRASEEELAQNTADLREYTGIRNELRAAKAEKDRERVQDLSQQLDTIGARLLGAAKLIDVTKQSSTLFHEQLFKSEAVHKLPTLEEFLAKRFGGPKTDKGTKVLGLETDSGVVVLSGIFIKKVKLDRDGDGHAHFKDIPGHVGELKDQEPTRYKRAGKRQQDAVIFYTISGGPVGKAGVELVKRLAEDFNGAVLVSTLSPIRDLYKVIPKDAFNEMTGTEIKQSVLDYLSQGTDPVAKFHLGNGATIGDININLGDPIDPITINYIYSADADERAVYASMYNGDTTLSVAGHLRGYAEAAGIAVSVVSYDDVVPGRMAQWKGASKKQDASFAYQAA